MLCKLINNAPCKCKSIDCLCFCTYRAFCCLILYLEIIEQSLVMVLRCETSVGKIARHTLPLVQATIITWVRDKRQSFFLLCLISDRCILYSPSKQFSIPIVSFNFLINWFTTIKVLKNIKTTNFLNTFLSRTQVIRCFYETFLCSSTKYQIWIVGVLREMY